MKLPHLGVPAEQDDLASCTAASVSSQLANSIDVTKTNELLGLRPRSQRDVTNSWIEDIDTSVAAWRDMVLSDTKTPMADRVQMVLRDEKAMRDSIAKEKIAKVMEAIGIPDMKAPPPSGVTISNAKLSADGTTYTCQVTLPMPAAYIRLDLKLDEPVALSSGGTLHVETEITISE